MAIICKIRDTENEKEDWMITKRMRINGVIRGGVVIPDTLITLPEGNEVEISFVLTELPPKLQAEFEA